MPQVFQVLKCFMCSVFQIHQTKKSNKFQCKMCGEKQSIKRHYGIGTGKDCRIHVQKLNALRGNIDIKSSIESNSDNEYEDGSETDENITVNIKNSETKPIKRSKWSLFVEQEKEEEPIEEPMFLGDKEVFLEIPQKKKAKKFKVKTKTSSNGDYSNYVNNNFENDLKLSSTVSYKDSNHSEAEEISVHNTISKDTDCQLSTCNIIVDNAITEKPLEKPILETVNKNSRWAQYVDTQDVDVHNVLSLNDSKENVSNTDNLFSLCDDDDLDNVLDI